MDPVTKRTFRQAAVAIASFGLALLMLGLLAMTDYVGQMKFGDYRLLAIVIAVLAVSPLLVVGVISGAKWYFRKPRRSSRER